MNYLNKKWIKLKNNNVVFKKDGKDIYLKNDTNTNGFIVVPGLINCENKKFQIEFEGEVINGNSALLYFLNLKKTILLEQTLNSFSIREFSNKAKALVAIKILPHSEVKITKLNIDMLEQIDYLKFLNNDILVVTPNYPSLENKYMCAFVHSRLKAYKESGIKFDTVVCHNYNEITHYTFEDISVLKIPFFELRNILQKKKYKKILLHFFDDKYARVLDACDLQDTELYFWIHGPETLYWDWPKFSTSYFNKPYEITSVDTQIFKNNDEIIKKYNNKPNVKWIFVSNWIKKRSEELINIKFNNYEIIPNIVDDKNFNYVEKNEELRKKIFFIRRFDDCDKYAIDVNVRAILELSKRDCFNDLEFNIYGIGQIYDKLVSPLKKFANVHLYPKFLTHEEIAKVHKENGIGLFATRYDAQGVSMCEAAMSGLAIVSTKNEAIEEFLPNDLGLLCDQEDYVQYADVIEKLYNNPKKFKECCVKCHDKVAQKCNFDVTIKKEIALIKTDFLVKSDKKDSKKAEKILSIVIPSYNVSQYLAHTINTILDVENRNKLEVIIVNDGSKDATDEVAKKLVQKYNAKTPIINYINKENGGHGSTINVGIAAATGKYIRIIDGDDWVNSEALDELITKLEKEDSDIVVTNYSEDRALENTLILKEIYPFMMPGLQYSFEDLCYENYGFGLWGPILATSNFKTQMLKDANFKITEKCFYVDMEFNAYSIKLANTITFYPLDIYRYFIGRSGQSISQDSYIKNRAQHEKVLFNLINYLYTSELSELKKSYILDKLIYPMIKSNYLILTEYLHNIKEFREFDKKLSQYPELYNKRINRYVAVIRKSQGLLLPFGKIMIKIFRRK